MDIEVNYLNLDTALSCYKRKDYVYVDVPWRVPLKYQRLTYPLLIGDDEIQKMVGSAEQSFLWLDLEGKLPKGKFVACTPCYRKETEYDALRRPYFMKIELYQNVDINILNMKAMVADALFVMQVLHDGGKYSIVETPEGLDINLNDIEVGSYGIRSLDNGHSWIYGTGLAEPRFSKAVNLGE